MRTFFQQADLAVAAFGVLFALCNCFLGYRLRKLWFALLGFILGGVFGFAISMWLGQDAGISTLIGIVAGAVVALLSFKLYLVGVFLLCGGLFFLVWSLLLPTGLSVMAQGMLLLGGVALSILIGILAIKAVRPVVMLTTAFSGGYTAVSGLFLLFHAQTGVLSAVLGIVLGIGGLLFQVADEKRRRLAIEEIESAKRIAIQQSYGDAPPYGADTPKNAFDPAKDSSQTDSEPFNFKTDTSSQDES